MNPLIYVLHSGNLYGTEQMALATLDGLRADHDPVLLAPDGPVHGAASALGIRSVRFASPASLGRALFPHFRCHRRLGFVATGVSHSLVGHALAGGLRRRMRHLHIVHGGTDERLSYGRKSLLAGFPVDLVAVSPFVRERLVAHGCPRARISVVENFLPGSKVPRREAFSSPGVRRVAVISRTDPIKRISLVLAALERYPALAEITIDVFGAGSELEKLRRRARVFPNLTLHGFVRDAAARLSDYDLLLHTCAEEPFGLALLEAMAAGVPVLAPNAGGAGNLVTDGVSGFHFPANDAAALGRRLCELSNAPADLLNAAVAGADAALAGRFSSQRGLEQYRNLLAWS